jgi:hypothetical protein
MDELEARATAVGPWMSLLDALETHCRQTQTAAGEEQALATSKARARRVLAALAAASDPPVPATVCAAERLFDPSGKLRDVRPAHSLREMWSDRDAVLRLGVWGALERAARDQPQQPQGAFDRLMAAISQPGGSAPTGLQPSRERGAAAGGFAHSADAALFFNGRLRKTLHNLARLYDARGATFARWLLPDYRPGKSALEPWSQAWTAAVVATYVDWLNRASGGSVATAAGLMWHDQPKRFRPAARVVQQSEDAAAGEPKPAVLPTDADRMHFELLTQIVLAQLIDYDAGRWAELRAGASRFAVALSMKALDQSDSRRWDGTLGEYRNFTAYRGLTVVQIYMAAVIDRLHALLPLPPQAQAA